MLQSFRTILFDADETLFDFIKSEHSAFHRAFQHIGVDITAEQFDTYRDINESLWLDYAAGKIKLDALRVERFSRFFEVLQLNYDPKQFSDLFVQFLGEGAYLLPESEFVCRRLVEAGFRIAIITNGIRCVQRSRVERSPIKNLLSDIFISEEIGYQKPDPRYFDYVVQALQITDRSECLIVGDSLQADILGGNQANIATCWFNPSKKQNTTTSKPTFTIERMEQLLELLNVK